MKLLCMIKKIVRDIIEDAIKHMIEDNEETVIYRVIKNLPVVSLFQYFPKSMDDSNDRERQHNRELLWSFKDGKDDEIMWAVVESFTKIIRKLLGNDMHDITIAFTPASDLRANDRRWRRFSTILADILGCDNGYKHLRPSRDSVPRHYIGGRGAPRALDVDEDYFDGKRVVLIDDLVNTGRTFRNAVETLRDAGADVILGLSVATT